VSPHLYPAPEVREKFLRALAEAGSSAELRGDAAAQGWDAAAHAAKYTLRCAMRGAYCANSRVDAGRNRAENRFNRNLQRERDFNQKILNTTQSMILVLDTAGLISYANRRCYETGYQEGELIGHRLVDWVEASHGKISMRRWKLQRMASSGESGTAGCGAATDRWGISRSA